MLLSLVGLVVFTSFSCTLFTSVCSFAVVVAFMQFNFSISAGNLNMKAEEKFVTLLLLLKITIHTNLYNQAVDLLLLILVRFLILLLLLLLSSSSSSFSVSEFYLLKVTDVSLVCTSSTTTLYLNVFRL